MDERVEWLRAALWEEVRQAKQSGTVTPAVSGSACIARGTPSSQNSAPDEPASALDPFHGQDRGSCTSSRLHHRIVTHNMKGAGFDYTAYMYLEMVEFSVTESVHCRRRRNRRLHHWSLRLTGDTI
jgi:ABC-type phosphate transport system ATPase subunit